MDILSIICFLETLIKSVTNIDLWRYNPFEFIAEGEEKYGYGATPCVKGVDFKVWAPNATAVFLEGSFNNWEYDGIPLNSDKSGNWFAHVEKATIGDEYHFIIYNNEERLIRIDPYARDMTNSAGNARICKKEFKRDTLFNLPPLNEIIIYELHVGTFSIHEKEKVGTLRDTIKKLDYLKELGINAIELMPVMEFPLDISWGYNPSHIFAVESAYGGPKALGEFVDEAHKRGLAVILDVVYNHFGPTDLSLWRFDGWYENDFGGIYFYNDDRALTPWGNTRPDYGKTEVCNLIKDNIVYWIRAFDIDGFRFDATSYIRSKNGEDEPEMEIAEGWSLLRELNIIIKEVKANTIIIAEDMKSNSSITAPVENGGAGFSAQWSPEFVFPIRESLIPPDDSSRDLQIIIDSLKHNYNSAPFRRVIYTESHDEVSNGKARIPQEIQPDEPDGWFARKRSLLGACILLTAPGIPMLFQGQELLTDKCFDDQIPLDWSRVEKYSKILDFYKDLIGLRRNFSALTAGLKGENLDVFHVNQEEKIIAFHRWDNGGSGDDVVVVMNFANKSQENYKIGFPQKGNWEVVFKADSKKYSDDFEDLQCDNIIPNDGKEDGFESYGEINISAYCCLVFSLKE